MNRKTATGSIKLKEDAIFSKIYLIRGEKVMLDFDLAILYEIETKVLKQAAKRNEERFPKDFMFELTDRELRILRSQFATSRFRVLKSQPVIASSRIYLVRGHRVMLDLDLAQLYGVLTGALNQAVARNKRRVPADFMFRLTVEEFRNLLSQSVIARSAHGGSRTSPFAFTEHGVAMLASVLRSNRAVAVNIEIIRAFIRLRRRELEHADLAKRIDELEGKYDASFKTVFDALRALMRPGTTPARPIGFRPERAAPRTRARK